MKYAILPIVLPILLIVIVMKMNQNIEAPGIFLTGALGLGIGVALNNLIFKGKKGTEKKEIEKK